MAVMTLVPASFELHRQINIAYVQQALINIAIDAVEAVGLPNL